MYYVCIDDTYVVMIRRMCMVLSFFTLCGSVFYVAMCVVVLNFDASRLVDIIILRNNDIAQPALLGGGDDSFFVVVLFLESFLHNASIS